ncbi:unnamed protein product [Schistocephalus solidus]|uniref:Zf-ANAPC11 domain-containing protein n=1 Tax=Schistocephalus solidus TaxID=70667 RepID=A0A183SPB6_SCHSO|nr:unnamed protein product [Schistocephalus solidus]
MLWRRKTQRSSSPGVPAGQSPQGVDEDAARTTAETTPPAPDATNPSEADDPTIIVSREAQIDQQQPQTKERADVQHFQLTKWNACAFWSWDVMHDTCVICRNGMMSLCRSH